MCVPSSTYCTHGAVKYWEYARQYLGGYGITLCCACTVVDATAWCHAQHHIECSIPRLAPLPFHLPFHQQGHLTVVLGCEVSIVLLSVNKIVVLNRCLFHHREFLMELLRYCCFACTVVYVLYSCCCKVLGVCMTVPWRFPYNSSMYCTHVFCF